MSASMADSHRAQTAVDADQHRAAIIRNAVNRIRERNDAPPPATGTSDADVGEHHHHRDGAIGPKRRPQNDDACLDGAAIPKRRKQARRQEQAGNADGPIQTQEEHQRPTLSIAQRDAPAEGAPRGEAGGQDTGALLDLVYSLRLALEMSRQRERSSLATLKSLRQQLLEAYRIIASHDSSLTSALMGGDPALAPALPWQPPGSVQALTPVSNGGGSFRSRGACHGDWGRRSAEFPQQMCATLQALPAPPCAASLPLQEPQGRSATHGGVGVGVDKEHVIPGLCEYESGGSSLDLFEGDDPRGLYLAEQEGCTSSAGSFDGHFM